MFKRVAAALITAVMLVTEVGTGMAGVTALASQVTENEVFEEGEALEAEILENDEFLEDSAVAESEEEIVEEDVISEASQTVTEDNTITPDGSIALEPDSVTGKCGDNAKWMLAPVADYEYILYITGSGAMYDYPDSNNRPWDSAVSVVEINIGNGITHIGNRAFEDMGNVKKITIPSTVTSIGDGAFRDASCTANQMVIPDSVTNLGYCAFNRFKCPSLVVGSGVTEIPEYAFAGIDTASITLKGAVERVGNFAFEGNITSGSSEPTGVLTEIKAPNGIKHIGRMAFYNCTGLTDISNFISKAVTIGDQAFYGCTGITSLAFPDCTESIGNSAFSADTAIESISFGTGLNSIGLGSFQGLPKITEITIPDSVTKLGNSAFSGCSQLTTVYIGNGIVDLPTGCFSNSSRLSSVTLGSKVETIGYKAFGYTAVSAITLPDATWKIVGEAFPAGVKFTCSTPKEWYYASGVANGLALDITNSNYYNSNYKETIIRYSDQHHTHAGKAGRYIRWSVDEVEGILKFECDSCPTDTYDMYDYPDLYSVPWNQYAPKVKTVTFDDRITHIGSYVLSSSYEKCGRAYYGKEQYDYEEVSSVTLPSSLKSIGAHAFEDNIGLTEVIIPEGVTEIGDYAFHYTGPNITSKIETISLPSSLKKIGNFAFQSNSKVKDFSLGTPEYIGDYAFYGLASSSTEGLASLSIPDSVKHIGTNAFYGANILSLEINPNADGLELCTFAFADMNNLTNVVMKDGTYLYDSDSSYGVFSNCSKLESATLPSGAGHRELFRGILCNCGALKTVTSYDGKGLKSLGNGMFECSSALTSVKLADGLTEIPYGCFHSCTSLSTLDIPDSVKTIGGKAFSYCTGLTSLELPSKLERIGSMAFNNFNTEGIKSLTVPDTVNVLEFDAFGYINSLNSLNCPTTGWYTADYKKYDLKADIDAKNYNGDHMPSKTIYREKGDISVGPGTSPEPTVTMINISTAGTGNYYIGTSANPTGDSISTSVKKQGADFVFYVTPHSGYEISAVKYSVGGNSSTLKGTNSKYTIPKAKLTGDVTITVEAVKTETAEISNIAGNYRIRSTMSGFVREISTVVPAKKSSFVFYVKADDGYRIDSVKYRYGAGASSGPMTLKASKSGAYTIPAANVSGEVKIEVATKIVELTSLSVTGVKKNIISQDSTTTQSYTLKAGPSDIDFRSISAKILEKSKTDGTFTVKEEPQNAVDVDGLKLTLTTGYNYPKDSANYCEEYIGFYYTDVEGNLIPYTVRNSSGRDEIYTIRIDVTSRIPSSTPTIKATAVTDTAVTLNIGLPKQVSASTKYMFYEITATTAMSSEPVDGMCEQATAVVSYETLARENGLYKLPLCYDVETDTPNDVPGQGHAQKYDVSVVLVQKDTSEQECGLTYKDGTLGIHRDEHYCNGSKSASVSVTTLEPAHATKFSVKTKNTKFYAGEGDILLAQVSYDKGCSYKELALECADSTGKKVLSAGTSGTHNDIYQSGLDIYMTAVGSAKLLPGKKYTVTLATDQGEAIEVSRSFDITVNYPINSVKITSVGDELYKKAGKAATYTAKAEALYVYEDEKGNEASMKPTSSKVEWSLAKSDGSGSGTTLTLKGGKVSIATNGKVTVDKSFNVKSTAEDNTFRIVCKAADWAGNTTSAYRVMTILEDEQTIESLGIKSGSGSIMALTNGQTYSASDLMGRRVVALDGAGEELSSAAFTLGGVMLKDTTGLVSLSKDGKATIKASLTNGYKSTKSITIKVKDFNPEAKISVTDVSGNAIPVSESDSRTYINNNMLSEALVVTTWTEFAGIKMTSACSTTIGSNQAKVVKKDAGKNAQTNVITPTAQKVEITVKNVNGTATKFTILNNKYATAAPPKLSVDSKATVYANSAADFNQNVAVSVEGSVAAGSMVVVTMDAAAMNKAKGTTLASYKLLSEQFKTGSTVSDGKATFGICTAGVAAGTYTISAVISDGEGNPLTKAATFKLKLTKAPKVTVKMTNKYTLKSADGYQTQVKYTATGNGSALVTKLYSVNTKGQVNSFAKYFKYEDGKIVLKEGVSASDIAYLKTAAGKKDLTGYIKYYVVDCVGHYDTKAAKNLKITLTLE